MGSRNNRRALKVLRYLRQKHSHQAKQIDILCRDMVGAHREFSVKLATLNFAVSFYESLLGCSDMETLLDTAAGRFRAALNGADAAIFLLSDHGFDVHIANAGLFEPVEKGQFANWFTPKLVDTISRMNRICWLEQMLRMGLQAPPGVLKTISLAAAPLGQFEKGAGFVLIYRPASMPLQPDELSCVAAVAPGLRKAIAGFMFKNSSTSANSGFTI
ncbi:MAG TPA: hypothetical protein PK052_05705 [Anaerohalosphaeraceae bacterium]|nr:hypothetical protein [Phycisphaerae bacterium]HOK96590.1 hypothetical protein [Anaerohalosphaeraceae bacterium]HOL31461.1 hypothetical protein [Anaerohalosphaeraceae bacterium]HOM76018.1 hypothetical protein [Anaerohalosphaeraceae bacterium]HPC64830.1 hypothetical protein [Anaerohalosphaeraceae bacterium]